MTDQSCLAGVAELHDLQLLPSGVEPCGEAGGELGRAIPCQSPPPRSMFYQARQPARIRSTYC